MKMMRVIALTVYGILLFRTIELTANTCETLTENVCSYKKLDSDYLSVSCSVHESYLNTTDILCAVDSIEDDDRSNRVRYPILFGPEKVLELTTSGSNMTEFDFHILQNFTTLQLLDISNSNLSKVTWTNCTILPNLTMLDLRFNNLTNMSQDFFLCGRATLQTLALTGNNWNCDLLIWFLDWVRQAEKVGLDVPNKMSIECHYFNMVIKKAYLYSMPMWKLIDACPSNCSCQPSRSDIMRVDCTGRGFLDFPEELPYNTRILNMENNSIGSFQRMLNMSDYQNITSINLNHNNIETLDELEGLQRSVQIQNFHIASNRLTHLPTYFVDQLGKLELSGNPWSCECLPGTTLRKFLIEHHGVVVDMDKITCGPNEGKHAHKVVHRLSQIDLCYSDETGIHYLDVVNVALALLIVILLSKLTYDWWHFKRNGYLPAGPTCLIHAIKSSKFRFNNVDA